MVGITATLSLTALISAVAATPIVNIDASGVGTFDSGAIAESLNLHYLAAIPGEVAAKYTRDDIAAAVIHQEDVLNGLVSYLKNEHGMDMTGLYIPSGLRARDNTGEKHYAYHGQDIVEALQNNQDMMGAVVNHLKNVHGIDLTAFYHPPAARAAAQLAKVHLAQLQHADSLDKRQNGGYLFHGQDIVESIQKNGDVFGAIVNHLKNVHGVDITFLYRPPTSSVVAAKAH